MGQTLGITVGIGVALGASVASSFQSLSSRVTGLSAKMKEMKTHQTAAAKLMAAESALASAKTAHLTGATTQTQKALDRAQLSFNRAAQSAKRYGIDAAAVTKTHASITSEIAKTESALGRLQQRQDNQAKRKEMAGEIVSTAAAAYVVTRPINAAMDFESEFAGLKKVADFKNVADEEAAKQDMLRISRQTGMNATDVIKLGTGAAQAGVVSNQDGSINTAMMTTFIEDASQMAVAFDISADEAAENMKKLQGTMGLTPAKARAMGDSINYLSNTMNATPAAIMQVTARIGSLAQTIGLSESSIAALGGMFVAASPSPEEASTAMKAFLLNLSKGAQMPKNQQEVLKRLGFSNTKAIAEGLKAGGVEAENTILMVLSSIKNMPAAQQSGILSTLFGESAVAAVAPVINDLGKLKTAFEDAGSEAAKGSMSKEFQSVQGTGRAAMERMNKAIDSLSITVGASLLPAVAATADALAQGMAVVQPILSQYPMLTQTVVTLGGAFIAAKIASLAFVYTGTMVSDAWGMAKTVGSGLVATYKFFTPTVMRSNAALALHKAQTVGATLASGRHRVVTLAGATATGIKTGALAAYNGAIALTRARTYAAIGGFIAQRAIMLGGAAVAGIMTAAQWGLNVALTANPVGLIVVGIAALAAGMVYLYNTCEPVRAAFDAVWAGIVTGVSKVWDYVQWVWGGVSSVLSAIGLMDDEADDASLKAAQAGITAAPITPQTVTATATSAALPPQAANSNYDVAGSAFGIGGIDVAAIAGAAGQHGSNGTSVSAPITLNISINGVPSQDVGQVLADAIRARSGEIEQQLSSMIDRIASNQRRLAYG